MKSTEEKLIAIYNTSRNTSNVEECDKAKFKIKFIILCFQFISIFTECDHAKIVKQLYFDYENINTADEVYISNKVYISVSTLYRYRQKYCTVAQGIIKFIDSRLVVATTL